MSSEATETLKADNGGNSLRISISKDLVYCPDCKGGHFFSDLLLVKEGELALGREIAETFTVSSKLLVCPQTKKYLVWRQVA